MKPIPQTGLQEENTGDLNVLFFLIIWTADMNFPATQHKPFSLSPAHSRMSWARFQPQNFPRQLCQQNLESILFASFIVVSIWIKQTIWRSDSCDFRVQFVKERQQSLSTVKKIELEMHSCQFLTGDLRCFCFFFLYYATEHHGYYHKKPKKVKPKVIIVKKIIPLSTTTFIGWFVRLIQRGLRQWRHLLTLHGNIGIDNSLT